MPPDAPLAELRFLLRRLPDGSWRGEGATVIDDAEGPRSQVSAASAQECLQGLQDRLGAAPDGAGGGSPPAPELAGVAEAAAILGWDKRRVATYVRRGSFPAPVALLAGGRVWRRADVEAFAEAFRERQQRRRERRSGGGAT